MVFIKIGKISYHTACTEAIFSGPIVIRQKRGSGGVAGHRSTSPPCIGWVEQKYCFSINKLYNKKIMAKYPTELHYNHKSFHPHLYAYRCGRGLKEQLVPLHHHSFTTSASSPVHNCHRSQVIRETLEENPDPAPDSGWPESLDLRHIPWAALVIATVSLLLYIVTHHWKWWLGGEDTVGLSVIASSW